MVLNLKISQCPDSDSHLRICLNDLGPAPGQLPRAENKSIVLPLFSRWETPISDNQSTTGDSDLTQGDLMYMDTKAIFVQIFRSIPSLVSQNPNLEAVAEMASTSRDQQLVRKGLKVRDMLQNLEEWGVSESRDGHQLMVEEVLQELVHLGNLRETVNGEISSLEMVYKTILDHNNYLRSQLESYKAYLQNVRVQSGAAKKKSKKKDIAGPFKFTHGQLEKDGIVVESNVPENRRNNIFFNVVSPLPGTFLITLHFKGMLSSFNDKDVRSRFLRWI
jgi:Ras GTPase-activating-like protein IQGAP2/3